MSSATSFCANVWKVYVLRMVSGIALGLWYPVVASYFHFFGMSQADMATLGQTFAVAFILGEIPSGYLADKIGRKPTLVLSGLLLVGMFLVISLTGVFRPQYHTAKALLVLVELMLGFCITLVTGTDQALLWESLPEKGRMQACAKHYSLIRMWESCATGCGALVGGLLFERSPFLPTTISIVFALAFPIIALTVVEPTRHLAATGSGNDDAPAKPFKWGTLALIGFLGIWYSFSPTFRTFSQLVLKGNDFSSASIGYAFGIGYITAGILAGLATAWVHKNLGELWSLVFTAAVVVLCYIGLGLGSGTVAICLVVTYLFVDVFGSVVLVTYIVAETPASWRATLMSVAGVISRVSSLILLELYKQPPDPHAPLAVLRETFLQAGTIAGVLLTILIALRYLSKRVSA